MKLDYVPGLSNEETMSFKTWLQQNKTKGANNVPRRFGDGKNVKCTVVLQGAFSKETKSLLDVGEYCASVFLIIKNMLSLFQLFYGAKDKPTDTDTLQPSELQSSNSLNSTSNSLGISPSANSKASQPEHCTASISPTIPPVKRKRYMTRSHEKTPKIDYLDFFLRCVE